MSRPLTVLMIVRPGVNPKPLLAFVDDSLAEEILSAISAGKTGSVRFYLDRGCVEVEEVTDDTAAATIIRAIALGGSIG